MLKMKAKIQVKMGSEAEMVSESRLFLSSINNVKEASTAEKNRYYGKDSRKRKNSNGEENRDRIDDNAPICHGTRAKRKRAFAGLSREIIQAELEEDSSNELIGGVTEDNYFGKVRKTTKGSAVQKGVASKIQTTVTANTLLKREQVVDAIKNEAQTKSKYKTKASMINVENQVEIDLKEQMDSSLKANAKQVSKSAPTNDKFFSCPKCCVYYNKMDIEQFKVHISTECCIKKQFPCELCGHIFTSQRVLSYHHQSVHEKPHPNSKAIRVKPRAEYVSEMSRIYELLQNSAGGTVVEETSSSGADNDSPSFHGLLENARKELDENEWPSDQKSAESLGKTSGTWKCWICFYESHQKSFWLSHVNRTHANAKGKFLACQYCEFPFTHKHHLREHLHQVHSDKCGYKCSNCERTFLHKKSRHLCLKIVCEMCSQKFDTKGARNKHQLSHSEHRPYSCELCSKTFQKQEYLALHMRTHNDTRPYQCDFCSKTFRSKSHYNNHRRVHTGEKPYICHTCGKSLSSPQSLYNHLQSHNETKKFSCSICSRSFRTSYDVKRHQVIHSGSKPFECKICKKKFNRRGNCLAHERKHIENVDSKTDEMHPKEKPGDQTRIKKPRKQSHIILRSH